MSSIPIAPRPVVWFYGLPGSGKSTIARGVYEKIASRKSDPRVMLISMDAIRKKIFPSPTYSSEERDAAYRSFVLIGSFVSRCGLAPLLDGTGHKKIWREFARNECPYFIEIYIKCPLELCIERETMRTDGDANVRKQLYAAALERLRTGEKKDNNLGIVPGVDEPFEEPLHPEIVLDSGKEKPSVLVDIALDKLSKFDPEIFSLN